MQNPSHNIAVPRTLQPYHHQVPPYGKQGDPYVVAKHPLTNPSVVSVSNSTKVDKWSMFQRDRLNHQLNKCFPYVYVLTHIYCLILNSVVQIGLQIALMATNGALWFVGAGIWAGVYFLITAGVTLLLVYNRNYAIFIITYVLHIFGILVATGAYLVVNALGIAEYVTYCSYYPNCFNNDVKAISYIMFFIGVFCIIQLLLYIVLMPCCILDVINQRSKYKEQLKEKAIIEKETSSLNHSIMYSQNSSDSKGNIKNPIFKYNLNNYDHYNPNDDPTNLNSYSIRELVNANKVNQVNRYNLENPRYTTNENNNTDRI